MLRATLGLSLFVAAPAVAEQSQLILGSSRPEDACLQFSSTSDVNTTICGDEFLAMRNSIAELRQQDGARVIGPAQQHR